MFRPLNLHFPRSRLRLFLAHLPTLARQPSNQRNTSSPDPTFTAGPLIPSRHTPKTPTVYFPHAPSLRHHCLTQSRPQTKSANRTSQNLSPRRRSLPSTSDPQRRHRSHQFPSSPTKQPSPNLEPLLQTNPEPTRLQTRPSKTSVPCRSPTDTALTRPKFTNPHTNHPSLLFALPTTHHHHSLNINTNSHPTQTSTSPSQCPPTNNPPSPPSPPSHTPRAACPPRPAPPPPPPSAASTK